MQLHSLALKVYILLYASRPRDQLKYPKFPVHIQVVIFENSSGNSVFCFFLVAHPVQVQLAVIPIVWAKLCSGRYLALLSWLSLLTLSWKQNMINAISQPILCVQRLEKLPSHVRADNCLEGWVLSSCGYIFNLIGLPGNES